MVSKEKINLDLWLRAKNSKGNMFYSKHPDRFYHMDGKYILNLLKVLKLRIIIQMNI